MAKTEIVQVNYWMEIRKDINKVIGDIHGLVLLTHNSIEFADIVDFLNKIRKDERLTVLYISLVNNYSNIKNALKAKPLDSKELFVVDCVSGFLIEIQDTVGCVYRKPPSNLEEMKDLIMKNIRMINPNIIVMDSLTQFINFTTPKDRELHEFYKFLKSMKEDAMGLINDTVILLYDDKMGSMKKLPILFADYILKLEIIREEIKWKD